MATYLQGQADYISQIQPTEPNLAFDAQVLQTKQSKYDANHKKVSELYGSLLNASMTRSDNIQARDEFFKIINDDIRRMGSLDFSLDQNVQAAAGVFQSIYDNKSIVKDMVWTKNYNTESERMEAFKNCIDEDKCGGSYWEEGDKFMQYKRLEYKNASAGDALGMGDVKFIPYKSVMKEAMKLAKDAGLNIEYDKLSPDGNYLITTKNGESLRSPLTALFNKTIGQNPQFAEMFKAKAYVDRTDWAYNKVNMGEYNDLNEAQLGYIKQVDKQNQDKLEAQAEALNTDIGHLDQRTKELEDSFKNGEFPEGSELYNQLIDLKELQQSAIQAKQYTDQIASIAPSNYAAVGVMTDYLDNQNAYTMFNEEIQGAVNTLMFKDAKSTWKADDFAKIRVEHKNKMTEMAVQHQYDMEDEALSQENKIALEDHKKAIGHSSYTGKSGSKKGSVETADAYITKRDAAKNYNPEAEARKILGKDGDLPTAEDVKSYEKGTAEYKAYQDALKQANEIANKKKREANKAAVEDGKIPEFREVMTATDIDSYNDEYEFDYKTNWFKNTYEVLLKKHKGLTQEDYNYLLTKANETDPLYEQLDASATRLEAHQAKNK